MANLASTFWNQGRWKEVEELEVQVMETSSRVLGEEHPDTLTSMANLGHTYHSQGQINSAIELMTKVVQFRLKRNDVDHSHTINDCNTLDTWCNEKSTSSYNI